MNNFLRFGDLIVFYGKGVDTLQPGPDTDPNKIRFREDSGGVLSAIGFSDTGVYYQNLPTDEEGADFSINQKINFANMLDSVFLITPKLNFDFHKDFKKTMKYYKNLVRTLNGAKNEQKERLEKFKLNLEAKLTKLKERMKNEQLLNQNIIRDNQKQVITYGSEVQLMHLNSRYFLKACNDCSQTDNIGYNCNLSSWYSGSMVFRIQPKFKSRQEGDVIQMRDHVILNNVKHDSYISMARELPIFEDFKFGDHVNPYLSKVSVFDKRCKRFRLFLSQESNCAFQIILYRKNTEPLTDLLMGGDLVKITHTEIQADLSASIGFKGQNKEVYMRHYAGEFKEEKVSLNSFWVMEHENFENAGDKFAIKEKESGSRLKRSTVRLRHLLSGNLLKQIQDDQGEESCYLNDNVGCKDYLLLDFEPVVKSNAMILNKQTYFLTSQDQQFLKYRRDRKLMKNKTFLKDLLKERDPEYDFYPLDDQDLNEEKYMSYFSNDFSSEDAFTIERMSDIDKMSCFFVRSLLPILMDVTSRFKVDKIDSVTNETYLQVKSAMQKIITFLFDFDSSEETNYFEIESDPIQKRQMILKDFGIIDVLVELLYYPFRNQVYELRALDKSSDFRQMLEFSYTTLRYTIMEYRPNELYASQWIGLIMHQSMHTRGHNDIRAGQTLTELIDNNERILENRIEKATIENFIHFLCHEDKDVKFLNILRAICICNEEPIIKNQKELSELMLQDKSVTKELLFELQNESTEGLVLKFNIPGFERVRLDELTGGEPETQKTFNYFVGLVRLLSDLCKDRNYLAIDILQKKFTYEHCFEIINGVYELEVREVFTSLMMNLWIDVSPFQPIQLPNNIKIWDELDRIEIFQDVEKKDEDRYRELKNFILKHIKFMNANDGSTFEENNALDFAALDLAE